MAEGAWGACCGDTGGMSVLKVNASATSIPNTDVYTVLALAASALIDKGDALELSGNAIKVKVAGIYLVIGQYDADTGTGANAEIRCRTGKNSSPVDGIADHYIKGASLGAEGGNSRVMDCSVDDLICIGANHLNGTGNGSCTGILSVVGPLWVT